MLRYLVTRKVPSSEELKGHRDLLAYPILKLPPKCGLVPGLRLLPQPETQLMFWETGHHSMVLMLAGFREGILLPCLFPMP